MDLSTRLATSLIPGSRHFLFRPCGLPVAANGQAVFYSYDVKLIEEEIDCRGKINPVEAIT